VKIMLGLAAGVFLGAFAVEMLERKRPGMVAGVGGRARSAIEEFRLAFRDGYAGRSSVLRRQ